MAVRHSRAVQRLSSATRQAESRPGRIGPISLDVKQMGKRSARNPHAAFDVEGLETWRGRNSSASTGAPVLDPTCERPAVRFRRATHLIPDKRQLR